MKKTLVAILLTVICVAANVLAMESDGSKDKARNRF
jgi:hypothetical protein